MDVDSPISFYAGRRKRFESKALIHDAFAGGSTKNDKENRYDVYLECYDRIKTYYDGIRKDHFRSKIDSLLQDAKKNFSISTLDITATTFYASAVPRRNEFFDLLQKAAAGNFKVARLQTGATFCGVENMTEAVVQQISGTRNSRKENRDFRQVETPSDILIIIDNILSFDAIVLEDFLLVLSQYQSTDLRFSIVAGFPEKASPSGVFPHSVLRKCNIDFLAISLEDVMMKLLKFIIQPANIPLQLSFKVFRSIVSATEEHSLGCDEFLFALRISFLEYFRSEIECSSVVNLDEQTAATSRKVKRTRNKTAATIVTSQFPACWVVLKLLAALEVKSFSSDSCSPKICYNMNEYEEMIGQLRSFDQDGALHFIKGCRKLLDDVCDGVIVSFVTDFRQTLLDLEEAILNIDELQRKADLEQDEAIQTGRTRSARISNYNPNRSGKLIAVQSEITEQVVASKKDIFQQKKLDLMQSLKTFLNHAVDYPSDEASSALYLNFDQVLFFSTRKIIASTFYDSEFSAAFNYFENSGPTIELSAWFDEFVTGFMSSGRKRTKKNDEAMVATFYKFLAELEFLGFIKRNQKKTIVNKLCWTTAFT